AAKGKGKAAGKKSNTAPQQPPSQPDPGHDFDDEIPF
ncbi:single-stranded DNA-binding protein, partial [Klebsiella pneumoniae]